MKKVTIFLIGIYLVLSLIITTCLLTYNKYNLTEMIDKVVVTSNKMGEKGSNLIIVDKKSDYKVGDEIYYYDSYSSSLRVSKSEVLNIEEITETENTLTLANNKYLSSEYVIGKSVKVIPVLGSLFDVLTSRVGYLLIIILPVFLLVLYSIMKLVKIVKVKNNEK